MQTEWCGTLLRPPSWIYFGTATRASMPCLFTFILFADRQADRQAPNPAKADLKRQLKNFKVRPAIEQAIVRELVPVSSAPPSQSDAGLAASVSSLASERPITPMPTDSRVEQ